MQISHIHLIFSSVSALKLMFNMYNLVETSEFFPRKWAPVKTKKRHKPLQQFTRASSSPGGNYDKYGWH